MPAMPANHMQSMAETPVSDEEDPYTEDEETPLTNDIYGGR